MKTLTQLVYQRPIRVGDARTVTTTTRPCETIDVSAKTFIRLNFRESEHDSEFV